MNQRQVTPENPRDIDVENISVETPVSVSEPVGETVVENPAKVEVSVPVVTPESEKAIPVETPLAEKSQINESEVAHAIEREIGDGDLKAAGDMVEATSFSD